MFKFALEGLTEVMYYELKPLNIELRLIEQDGSTDNNFAENITWNLHSDIRAYDKITHKIQHLITTAAEKRKDELDDPMDIVNVLASLATGENKTSIMLSEMPATV